MSLTVDDIIHLERSTRYREEDIRRWFRSDPDTTNIYKLIHRIFFPALALFKLKAIKLYSKYIYINYNTSILHACFSIFKTEFPSCQMGREQVVGLYSSLMPLENAERFVDQLFRTFDQDDNGYIDFHVC